MKEEPTNAPARDPFYVVKDKVQIIVRTLRIDFDKWKDLLDTVNTATNSEFKSKANAIKQAVKKLKVDLNDLTRTIDIVENNRSRFPDIDDAELAKRKQFINDTKAVLAEVVDTLNSDRVKSKINTDKSKASGVAAQQSLQERVQQREEKDFVHRAARTQEQAIMQQDEVLDDIQSALARLGDMGTTINVELEDQNKMLTEFSNEIDETQDTLTAVTAKIQKLLGTSDKGKLFCIFFLFIIVVILFFVLIYG